jgi:hypothetical protein
VEGDWRAGLRTGTADAATLLGARLRPRRGAAILICTRNDTDPTSAAEEREKPSVPPQVLLIPFLAVRRSADSSQIL